MDGIEMVFAVNHLAYFLITMLLLDRIKQSAPARIVNVASEAHRFGTINFDDLGGERRYRTVSAYGQSKLANILFTYELARRLAGTGVTVNCLHPGGIASGLWTNNGRFAQFLVKAGRPFLKTPAQAHKPPSTWRPRPRSKASAESIRPTARRRTRTGNPTILMSPADSGMSAPGLRPATHRFDLSFMERVIGFEPTTLCLASTRSTN